MRKRWLIFLLVVLAGAGIVWWAVETRNAPRTVPFTKVARGTIASTISTNGKVEPIEWASARAEQPGAVANILVQRGQLVEKGAALVEQDTSQAQADLAAAEARITQARADLEVLSKGGRPSELADIDGSLARERLELQEAQRELETQQRLLAKQAATQLDVTNARDRVERAKVQIQSLEKRRAALVAPVDRSVAEARLKDAQTAAAAARDRIARSTARAPIAGTIYDFDIKRGAYLNPGDVVANIGRLDKVRVTVYVDEPELGRVGVGMPVTITWDGQPGRKWSGVVEKLPTRIQAQGTRQVGEVPCVIDNPGRDLLPNANVNVDIRAQLAENVLILPKEAIRNDARGTGVYLLEGDHVAWHKVNLGVSSLIKTQVEGLNEGDAVALALDGQLKDGVKVVPAYRD